MRKLANIQVSAMETILSCRFWLSYSASFNHPKH